MEQKNSAVRLQFCSPLRVSVVNSIFLQLSD